MYEGHSVYKVNFSMKIFLVKIKALSCLRISCKLHVVCALIAYCFAFDFSILQKG